MELHRFFALLPALFLATACATVNKTPERATAGYTGALPTSFNCVVTSNGKALFQQDVKMHAPVDPKKFLAEGSAQVQGVEIEITMFKDLTGRSCGTRWPCKWDKNLVLASIYLAEADGSDGYVEMTGPPTMGRGLNKGPDYAIESNLIYGPFGEYPNISCKAAAN
ncbi:MAG: hypothetical protein ACXWR1_18530 [Bdellovibrionota bacterium]